MPWEEPEQIFRPKSVHMGVMEIVIRSVLEAGRFASGAGNWRTRKLVRRDQGVRR